MPKQCKKCKNDFPLSQKIDGKIRNLSKRSYCLDCSPFNNRNKTHLNKQNIKSKKCSICLLTLPSNMFYTKRKVNLFSYCIPCEKNRKKKQLQNFKKQCVNYKGGKCVRCGYNKCLAALEFHHLDPSKKEFNISHYRGFKITSEIERELDKCDLLCSNCHKEVHYEL